MIELRVTAADIARVRFAYSPLWETVLAVRVLAGPQRSAFHAGWAATAATAASTAASTAADLDLLTTVIRPRGFLPDFLHPMPPRRTQSFGTGLAALQRADLAQVSAELRHLAGHAIANAGPGRAARARRLRALAAAPEQALADLANALRAFWQAAVRPHWPRIEALLLADLDARLGVLGAGGVDALLRHLHPAIAWDGRALRITKYYDGVADLTGRGLVLIPSVFAWPEVIVRVAGPLPALTYAPRGIGTLWADGPPGGDDPLARVLGRTRATLLRQLDVPATTTELAAQLDLAPPSVSAHLQALLAAGILARRRIGQTVLYRRTDLGEALLQGSAAGPGAH